MLNWGYKKEALAEARREAEKYKSTYDTTINHITVLHTHKEKSVDILKQVDIFVHSISNKPPELDKMIFQINVQRQAFEKEVNDLQIESKNIDKISGTVVGAGVAAGTGVAAFGPTVAMSIATTFGTASTGTAIATLHGAVATKAALAWLGGGALTAGGGGIAAGKALLAMAGPVGWTIGGVALLSGGLLANNKNKKIAEKAEKQTKEIKDEVYKLNRMDEKVNLEIKAISSLNVGVMDSLDQLKKINHRDYKKYTDDELNVLQKLMNSSNSLSKKIGEKIVC